MPEFLLTARQFNFVPQQHSILGCVLPWFDVGFGLPDQPGTASRIAEEQRRIADECRSNEILAHRPP